MKILKIIGWIFATVLVLLVVFYVYKDPENLSLDQETRAELGGSYLQTPVGTVHYEMTGPKDAEIVVLVHGFSVPAYLWQPTVDFLRSEGFRVLRFDLFGRGLSDRPDKEFGLELFSLQIRGVLHALNISRPINLVGLSMGGPIVTRFTHENPDKVKRLILQDPLVHQIPLERIYPLNLPFIGEYLATVLFMPSLIQGNLNSPNEKFLPGWGQKYRQQIQFKGFRRAILSSTRYLASHRLVAEYEQLAKVSLPKLLIWGDQDKVVPYGESETLTALMPDIRFETIQGAGHIPSVEKPDEFNQILLSFLNEPIVE